MLGFLIVVVILIVIILVAKNFAAQENGLNIEKTDDLTESVEDLTDDLREKKVYYLECLDDYIFRSDIMLSAAKDCIDYDSFDLAWLYLNRIKFELRKYININKLSKFELFTSEAIVHKYFAEILSKEGKYFNALVDITYWAANTLDYDSPEPQLTVVLDYFNNANIPNFEFDDLKDFIICHAGFLEYVAARDFIEKESDPNYMQAKKSLYYDSEKLKKLKQDKKHDEVIEMLMPVVEAGELIYKLEDLGVAPSAYNELAIVYRKKKDYKSEVEILTRFSKQKHAPGVMPEKLKERLEKAKLLLAKT